MCDKCAAISHARRTFIVSAGLALASTALATTGAWAAGGHGPTTHVTPDEALANLKAGNARYVSAPEVCSADLTKRRGTIAAGQTPWATVLSCSDSRVPPELLFGGLGLGEIFVARNAGNMVDTATMGTIEYGASALGVPLIVVLGHERCGAVSAACDVVTKKATYPGAIGPMVKAIVPAAMAARSKPGDFIDNTVRESARRSAAQIATGSKIVADLIKAKKVKVVAARYDLDDGTVEFLDKA